MEGCESHHGQGPVHDTQVSKLYRAATLVHRPEMNFPKTGKGDQASQARQSKEIAEQAKDPQSPASY
jgi:hypothetical protein